MILSLKSTLSKSRRVDNEERCIQQESKYEYFDKDIGSYTSLTVWRKSLLVSCNGFTVIDSNGDLAYRVDNYSGRPGEIVLMNGSGKSMHTMRRQKKITLVDDWLVYDGEATDIKTKTHVRKQPAWHVKKQISLLQTTNSKELAHVFLGTSSSAKSPTYVIQGSYGQRCCKVLDKSSMKIVAEIKRKEAINGSASFGQEVFHLIVWPGFDTGFAMTLVLLLDQMFS